MKRRVKVKRFIPLCSMADIAFILLIFFMVTTTLHEQGLRVELPKAEKTEKVEVEEIEDIFINSKGEVMIDGEFINPRDIKQIFYQKRQKNERFIVALNADKNCPYGTVSQVLDELKLARAIQVSFIVEKEPQNNQN
ncbi:MAG: biopolymer transporter ExbD [bacterium]|nr:biopolymer transporter ExbD [bacterium]